MKKLLFRLFCGILSVICLSSGPTAFAASMAIDSFTGPLTQNEINSFKTYMLTQTPGQTPWGPLNGTGHNEWCDFNSGNALEAFGLMYEATGDIQILTNMIHWADTCTSERNDLMAATNGGQRVCWDGVIDPIWVAQNLSVTNPSTGCETGDTQGHLAYCALLILQNPSLWNQTVPDGDPFGYGTTYFQRATNYVAKVDEANNQYVFKYFIQSGTDLIRDPTDPRWAGQSVAINRQAMFFHGFIRMAECHEILGDNPSLAAQYEAIGMAASGECINGMKNSYVVNSDTCYKWGYYPTDLRPTESFNESVGHGAYDIEGVWRAYEHASYNNSLSSLKPLANAFVDVMNVSTNLFSGNVDGTGTTQSYMQQQWLWLAELRASVYDSFSEAAVASGRLAKTPFLDAVVLWEKNRRYQQFSLAASPSTQTVGIGEATNFTVAVTPLGGTTNTLGLTVSGLPSGAVGTFTAPQVNLAAVNAVCSNVTLSITTSISTPAGTYPLTITGTNGTVTHTTNVTLIVGNFSLSASPPSQTVSIGVGTSYTVSISTNNGFSGTVSFGISGLPANTTAGFSPASLSGAGSSTLTVNTTGTTPSGNYTLIIYGTNGSVIANAPVTLTVVGATPVWNGGSSSDSDWSDAANWGGNGLTVDAPLVFSGTVRLNNTNDTTAATKYSNIVFNPGSGAFTLYGNSITVGGNVTNNSANSQTINLALSFSSGFTLNGASDPLVLSGKLTNSVGATGATTINLAGTGQLADLFYSAISPGGTNILLVNDPAANWTLLDNTASLSETAPWLFEVNQGTFNYGASISAPIFNSTTLHNGPSDNQVGTVSGATGTFNMVKGTFTTSARFNTALAANSTGIINQTGGTWNMGEQFQGANGSNPGEVSLVTVSGGTMNIGGGGGAFYVASRGTGTLTLNGTGAVNCGLLDISRNANGNAVSSVGTVNLSGGTLMVMAVTNISANAQTGGSPTAVFNFNGGTLVAKAGASNNFFHGCTATPVTPITAIVQVGGAIIDDGGQSINFLEPLQHDSSLGSDLDGGLTKLDTGTLTLTTANTYNGDTIVSAGTLALSGAATISGSDSINVASGATLDASVSTGSTLNLAAAQTLTGSGTVKGNVIAANGATLAPGGSLSTLTFNNNLTLNGGSTTVFEVSKSPTTNDFAQVAGTFALGGTIVITNVGATPYAPGDSFQLFSAAGYSGAFTNIQPVIPAVNLAWNTNNLSAGILSIVSAPTASPQITSAVMTGGNFIFSATNGVPNWPCYIFSTTNVSLPVNQWAIIATNPFDMNGSFNFTNSPDPSLPQLFYLLQLQ